MCGFLSYLHAEKAQLPEKTVASIIRNLKHRGPDGDGHYNDDHVQLIHTRLSIIDLSQAAGQPFVSTDGNLVINYNGEVYNYIELKDQLIGLGHIFRTHSDTEVILAAYQQWGPQCVERFNGMFAFTIWNKNEKQLFVARDRYGIKPLYFAHVQGGIVFASEIKAILASRLVSRGVNIEGLYEYISFQNFLSYQTLYADIDMFPQGSYAIMNLNNIDSFRTFKYWDYDALFAESLQISEEEAIEQLDHLLNQSVKRHLISDRTVGCFLSGGIDSALITVLAAQQAPDSLLSYTIGFDLNSASGIELNYDEREYAEYISYLAKTEHYEMVLKAGDMERIFGKLVQALEEPRIGQSYPNYYASKLASKFGPVALSGCGGDELFAGYPWRYLKPLQEQGNFFDAYYHSWKRLISEQEMVEISAPMQSSIKNLDLKERFLSIFPTKEKISRSNFVSHCLYFEAKTFLHSLLVVDDKLAMANGLEIRTPFLDNDLVDFVLKLPMEMKILTNQIPNNFNENEGGPKVEKYYQTYKNGKLILRKLAQKYLPDKVTFKEKIGFSSPDNSWFRSESLRFVDKKLSNNQSKLYDYLDYNQVRKQIDEHLYGNKNRRLFIWSMLYLVEWFDQFIEQPMHD